MLFEQELLAFAQCLCRFRRCRLVRTSSLSRPSRLNGRLVLAGFAAHLEVCRSGLHSGQVQDLDCVLKSGSMRAYGKKQPAVAPGLTREGELEPADGIRHG